MRTWSLRIRFPGAANLDVAPRRWRLEAWGRAEGLTTGEGVRFCMYDAENLARLNLVTDQFSGTSGWRLLEQEFRVPPATRLLRLQIVRLPSRRIDSKIAGALWLEDNGRSSEGESWCRRALGLQQESVGSDDLITAMILGTLGEVLADLGRHDEAEECYRRFVEIRENLDGPFHLEVVVTLEKLASL